MKAIVNGTTYTNAHVQGNEITLTSDKHPIVMRTTMEELRTHYGRKAAYSVHLLLAEKGIM